MMGICCFCFRVRRVDRATLPLHVTMGRKPREGMAFHRGNLANGQGEVLYGYNGRALVVNLTRRTSRWQKLDDDVLRRFIGGTGLGAYLLYEHCPPGVEPLSPDNPLIFVTSPLVGSRLTTSSKFAVLTKSPLTGFIGDSLSSSFMATELKKTGCDALIITGKSEQPCLLSIDDGEVDFLDGSDLMGLSTSETERAGEAAAGTSQAGWRALGRQARIWCGSPVSRMTEDGQAARTGPRRGDGVKESQGDCGERHAVGPGL